MERFSTIRSLGGLLHRLLKDSAGNTLFMIAAALVPLLAMIGGGVDMGRSYLTQSRLQQACDAGVLAARRKLGGAVVATDQIPVEVSDTGNRFFNLNFAAGSYGTINRGFRMTLESDYSISGLATVEMPTTIMAMFGHDDIDIAARCEARLNYSNTDIMFVLDTTGSMNWSNPGDTQPRIDALRTVVRNFHAQLEANKSPGTRLRYGFVPYSTNVNVGALLKPDWVTDTWSYQGRALNSSGQSWRYQMLPNIRVDSLKDVANGRMLINRSIRFAKMGGKPGAPTDLLAWFRGCMEERQTYQITDYDNVDLTRALDLDIDLVPKAGMPHTQWRPMLPEASYIRAIDTSGRGYFATGAVESRDDFLNVFAYGFAACPAAAQKLQVMNAQDIAGYVNGLFAGGNTYHDIGMIWGARLLSPTGLFAAENADQPGKITSRHLIFLTDGETAPHDLSYGSYGIEPLDRRRWSPGASFTLSQVVENRFMVACTEAKKRNIAIWVIGFGVSLNPLMTDCAGSGHAFEAKNTEELEQTFAHIAAQLGDLRVSR